MTSNNYDFSKFIEACKSYNERSEIIAIVQEEIKTSQSNTVKTLGKQERKDIGKYTRQLTILRQILESSNQSNDYIPEFIEREADDVYGLLKHLYDKGEYPGSAMSKMYPHMGFEISD